MRLALRVAYDGTCFYGSARQPDVPTVEGTILERLMEMDAVEGADEARFQAASRTDAGVSAAGNVVAFDTGMPPRSVVNALAYGLACIWPLYYAAVDDDFKPRHTLRKTYRYYLYNEGYDREAMDAAARCFEGSHDFSAFARLDGRSPVREIHRVDVTGDDILAIDVVGRSFLWQQVRRMVAALQQVGRGELPAGVIGEVLQHPAGRDFGLAAPERLLLLDIEYGRPLAWMNAPGRERLVEQLHAVQVRGRMYGDIVQSSK